MRSFLFSLVFVYVMCGPSQFFFFQCGPESPKGWTALHVCTESKSGVYMQGRTNAHVYTRRQKQSFLKHRKDHSDLPLLCAKRYTILYSFFFNASHALLN